jgi:hypothetical protein
MRTFLVFVFATLAASIGFAQKFALDSARNITPVGTKVDVAEYRGRKAVRLVEPTVNNGGELALIDGVTFHNGTIEAEVAGFPAKGALPDSRGFIGIAFRIQSSPVKYEAFYLRPTNGRADDQLRRNHSTQYVSEPEFPWQRLRKENPGVYESYVDLDAGAWTKIRIVVDGVKARLYVHGAEQPALIVNDLKLGDRSGGVGLWIGQGTEAYFSSLNVSATK